jgi:uncharacterized protein (TIGR00251 family)
MGGLFWTAAADGLVLSVRLTPRGGRDAIEGLATLADGRNVLHVRVRAAPSEGEANAALVELLAKALRVRAGDIRIVAGKSARLKRIRIEGDGAALAARLERLLGGA